jgi:hypothetical protein
VLGAGLALLLIAAAIGIGAARGPDRHEEGQGELAMFGDTAATSTISDFAAESDSRPTTFGLPLCHLHGDTPVLDRVTATTVVGDGFTVLGTGVRTFIPAPDHTPIYSVDGWPPNPSQVPDAIEPVVGFAVTNPCTAGVPDGRPYTELLVAMQRTSPAGGGWFGFEVGYTVGGRHRVLHSTWNYGVCGTAVHCEGSPPSPSP